MLWELPIAFLNIKNHQKNYSSGDLILNLQAFCKHNNQKMSIYKALKPVFIYSHSIVAGGLDEISYTTLFIPFTLFIILFETVSRNS